MTIANSLDKDVFTLPLSLSHSFTRYINTLLDTLGTTNFTEIREMLSPSQNLFVIFSGKFHPLTDLGKSPGIQNVPREAARDLPS